MERLADKNTVANQIKKIRQQLAQVDVEYIFKMDETGLFYLCFPRGYTL